ncbi:hypothetical protein MMC10_009846 [Thelotrema lepadinum]|nr:hypothetical protein [Thelotrema lepadinum]
MSVSPWNVVAELQRGHHAVSKPDPFCYFVIKYAYSDILQSTCGKQDRAPEHWSELIYKRNNSEAFWRDEDIHEGIAFTFWISRSGEISDTTMAWDWANDPQYASLQKKMSGIESLLEGMAVGQILQVERLWNDSKINGYATFL